MECGKIDKTVGGQEKVGDERSDGIQLGDDDAAERDNERQNIASHGFVVFTVTFSKRFQVRV